MYKTKIDLSEKTRRNVIVIPVSYTHLLVYMAWR